MNGISLNIFTKSLVIQTPLTGAQPLRQKTKLETASGGSYQKPLKSFGDLTFETQYCTGFAINLSANSPPVSCSTSEDPIGLRGGLNLFQMGINDTINFNDPFGTTVGRYPWNYVILSYKTIAEDIKTEKMLFDYFSEKTSTDECQKCIAGCLTSKTLNSLSKHMIIEIGFHVIATIFAPEIEIPIIVKTIVNAASSTEVINSISECKEECSKECCKKNH